MAFSFPEISRRAFLGGTAGAFLATALPSFPLTAAGVPRRIILDTDPGVDDAMAIFLALRSPELKVEAITTLAGNVPLSLTLPNALRLVEIAGRPDIPVAAGAAAPLVRRLVTARYAHGNNGLGGVEFPEAKLKPVGESAMELIRRIIHANPGEISIVAVGPLTNVATALVSDPSLAAKIQSIVVMGGSLTGGNITPSAEFNFYVDPEAARIVFDCGVPLTMVGLNVTNRVQIHDEQIRVLEAAQNPVSQAAGKIMRATLEHWQNERQLTGFGMHDPVTVAHVIDPTILTLKDYYVQIETTGELTAGESVAYSRAPRPSPPLNTGLPATETSEAEFKPNCKVAVEADADKFFRLLLSRLTTSS
jgi:pyrimidine-specific ribonucleoside hydrolase